MWHILCTLVVRLCFDIAPERVPGHFAILHGWGRWGCGWGLCSKYGFMRHVYSLDGFDEGRRSRYWGHLGWRRGSGRWRGSSRDSMFQTLGPMLHIRSRRYTSWGSDRSRRGCSTASRVATHEFRRPNRYSVNAPTSVGYVIFTVRVIRNLAWLGSPATFGRLQ